MQGKKLHIILFAFIAVALNSCNINSYVPEGKYLVKKNTVVIEEKKTELSKSKLSSYITLKPYKAALQTNIPFWVYYKAEQRPNSKFWKWMKRNFAKEPVYYDKEEANRSSTQMMRYLDKVGHFHSDVSHSVKYRKKRAYITYDVKPTKPYHINKIDYVIDDSLMESFIMRDKKNFPINEGDIYNEFSIGDQRDMITDRLKNSGYYYFNRDNILYEVDSNFMNHSMSVTMKVANNPIAHRRYYINDISVYPNFSIFKMNEQPSDSATLSVKLGRRQVPNTLNFYYYGEQNVKPQTFSRAIQIIQGRPYRLNSVTNTYKGINNLHFFNNVNINFDSVANTVETLGNYGIAIDKIKATIGPTVTLYEIVPAAGVRISKIKNLEDDIALSLAALGIRIIAPIPGKGTIGIEVPNSKPETVSMRSVLSSEKFQNSKYALPCAIGKTISNETYVFDLAKMPHILGWRICLGNNIALKEIGSIQHSYSFKTDKNNSKITLFLK